MDNAGFSSRTRMIVSQMQSVLEPTPRQKRSKGSSGPAAGRKQLNLSDFTSGKSRQAAAVAFYEMLVLKNKGLLDLQQARPYEDIIVHADMQELMAA